MADIAHYYGNDLASAANGDLLTADGSLWTQQRVLRRLMTNTGEYFQHQEYGAGLGSMVGKPADADTIQAVILRQMLLEAGVSQSPSPTVSVVVNVNGTVTANIVYTDASNGTTQTLAVPIGG